MFESEPLMASIMTTPSSPVLSEITDDSLPIGATESIAKKL